MLIDDVCVCLCVCAFGCLFVLLVYSCFVSVSLDERIQSVRQDFIRQQDRIAKCKTELASAMTDDQKQRLETEYQLQMNALKRLDEEWASLTGENRVKKLRSSFTVTVPGGDVTEAVLWKAEVTEKNVPRTIVKVDSLLAGNREIITELRWLHLKLIAPNVSLDAVNKMRANREKGQHDLEVPYHPLLLLFYQAASRGQQHLEFLSEDFTSSKPREDIRGMINGRREVPQECKSECVFNNSVDPQSVEAIDRNSEALGKLLQVSLSSSASSRVLLY